MPPSKERFGLTGNQLKIIAMIAMTLDHVGMVFFPGDDGFRILGRLALPIYAYMIAEGCHYTHDRKRYFFRLFGLGALCQIVYFFAMGSLYQCILITFSLSVAVICLVDWAAEKNKLLVPPVVIASVLGVRFFCDVLPGFLPGTDYAIDYGTCGVLLPVLISAGNTKKRKILLLCIGLTLLALDAGGLQWFSLAAVPLLALYNGRRGKYAIGKLFYIYYPLHLVVIQGLHLVL